MSSTVDVEDVRVHLEQLMNETSIRRSIRKQIETLHERNKTHKKRINIENRILKNLRSQGILDKIIDHLTSNKSPSEITDFIKDSKTEFNDKQPEAIAISEENNQKKYQKNSSLSQEFIEPQNSQNGQSSSFKNSGTYNVRKNDTEEEKISSSTCLGSRKKNKYKKGNKEKDETKVVAKPPEVLDSKCSLDYKTLEKETAAHSKSKHVAVDDFKLKSESDEKLPKIIHSQKDSHSPEDKITEGTLRKHKKDGILVKINPRRRHLHFEILQGKAFLDHLLEESFTMFVLFLNFRGQRFWTQPVPCESHPNFDAGFLYELHDNELDETQMARPTQLLNVNEKIHIVLARILPNGEKVLVSSHHFEWRQILFAQESRGTFSVDLLGVGAESNIVVGVIDVNITLIPKLLQPLTEKTVLSRIRVVKRNQEEQDRIFLMYAKSWWKEYLSLRPEHSQRTVKLFHQDENGRNRPVFHFVQLLKVGRPLLELPHEAAWFVSLIQLQPPSLVGALPAVEQWYTPHTFLCIKKGGSENHATLLCSLFLGFGLDAYVCIGTKEGNIPWAWVVTISKDNYATFWESTTGSRYGHDPQLPSEPYKYSYPYKTIGCLFNHKSFYANIQESDKVKSCLFNLANKRLWKNLSEAAISSVVQNFNLFLMPGWTEPFIYSQEMETELRARITEYRQLCMIDESKQEVKFIVHKESMEPSQHLLKGSNIGLPTRWDVDLCHFIAPVLALYEMELRMGLALRKEEIDDLISKNIPDGFSFRALPMRVAVEDKKRVLGVCLRNAIMESIVSCPETGCKMALRVHTYVYPENILSIWLIVANKFRLATYEAMKIQLSESKTMSVAFHEFYKLIGNAKQ